MGDIMKSLQYPTYQTMVLYNCPDFGILAKST